MPRSTWVPVGLMIWPELTTQEPLGQPAAGGALGLQQGAQSEQVIGQGLIGVAAFGPVLEAGQLQLWEGSHAIDANLRLEAAPGHTPGHGVIKLESSTDRALFAADILHTPLQVTHPDYSSCFCQDPSQARATRLRLLGWAADNNALVVPAHFSGHSALEVQHHGGSFTISKWAPFAKY